MPHTVTTETNRALLALRIAAELSIEELAEIICETASDGQCAVMIGLLAAHLAAARQGRDEAV